MNPVKGEVCSGVVFDAVLVVRNEVHWSVPDTSYRPLIEKTGYDPQLVPASGEGQNTRNKSIVGAEADRQSSHAGFRVSSS
jgi:hypothetical protein